MREKCFETPPPPPLEWAWFTPTPLPERGKKREECFIFCAKYVTPLRVERGVLQEGGLKYNITRQPSPLYTPILAGLLQYIYHEESLYIVAIVYSYLC